MVKKSTDEKIHELQQVFKVPIVITIVCYKKGRHIVKVECLKDRWQDFLEEGDDDMPPKTISVGPKDLHNYMG